MGERWLWTQKEDIGPSPRFGHAMAYEAARQCIVLFGYWANNDTWEWDGATWTQVADMGPSMRSYSAMAYDDSRQRLVLFGGLSTTGSSLVAYNDTWEWNGTEWTQVADIGPPPRWGCAMSYDTVRQRVVLFGGYDNSRDGARFGDTWEWDGTEWTQIADTGPSGRGNPTMVFDSSRECLVLFGGFDHAGTWLGDTWEWNDNTGWAKRQDIGPRDISTPKMTYTGKHTVLFGTPTVGSAAGQTWEWDGSRWTQRQNMGPSGRTHHTLAYDGLRDRVVLFGGVPPLSASYFGDTWELAIIK